MSHPDREAQPEASVVHLIRRAEQCALVALQKRAEGIDHTPTQISVLTVISAHPGLSQTALCKATGIDRSTMADVVLRLVKKGLAKRARKRVDARTYAVELTAQGNAALEAAAPFAAMAERDVLAVLPPDHRRAFMKSLRMIVDACHARRDSQEWR